MLKWNGLAQVMMNFTLAISKWPFLFVYMDTPLNFFVKSKTFLILLLLHYLSIRIVLISLTTTTLVLREPRHFGPK